MSRWRLRSLGEQVANKLPQTALAVLMASAAVLAAVILALPIFSLVVAEEPMPALAVLRVGAAQLPVVLASLSPAQSALLYAVLGGGLVAGAAAHWGYKRAHTLGARVRAWLRARQARRADRQRHS